jgi:hypothetical protein
MKHVNPPPIEQNLLFGAFIPIVDATGSATSARGRTYWLWEPKIQGEERRRREACLAEQESPRV